MAETHALAPLPRRTPDGRHRFDATSNHDLLALSEYILCFVRPSCNRRFRTHGDAIGADHGGADFENFRYSPSEMGEPIGPRSIELKQAGAQRGIFGRFGARHVLAPEGPLWQEPARL
jgi:hypothetical protein